MIIRALSLHDSDAKPLECISGAKISAVANANAPTHAKKFILHAKKLLPHKSSMVLKDIDSRGQLFTIELIKISVPTEQGLSE